MGGGRAREYTGRHPFMNTPHSHLHLFKSTFTQWRQKESLVQMKQA